MRYCHVRHDAFDFACNVVFDLILEVRGIEFIETMQFDETPVIGYAVRDGSSYGDRNPELWISRIEDVEVPDCKFGLQYFCKVDEIDFGLERSPTAVC